MLVRSLANPSPHAVTTRMAQQYSEAAINSFVGHAESIFAELYRRAFGSNTYTIEQFFAHLAMDAAEFVDVLQAVAQLIAALKGEAPAVAPEGITVTANEDGTVTVTRAQKPDAQKLGAIPCK